MRDSSQASSRPAPFARLDFLDALRCYAALYVLLYHMALIPRPPLAIPVWIAAYAGAGGTGVSLFFVLSAFALAYSWDARASEPAAVRRFYLRRLFRIAPLFYVMLVFSWMRDAWLFDRVHGFSDVLINASLLFNLSPEHLLGIVWASWTIGVEVLFYLAFPLIHRVARHLSSALALFVGAVMVGEVWAFGLDRYGALPGGLDAERIATLKQFGILKHAPAFLAGVLAYRLLFDYLRHLDPDRQRRVGLALLMSFAFLYTALLGGRLQNVLWDGSVWQAVAYACLVLGLGLAPLSLFVNNVTVSLGKTSYSLYLLHPTLVLALVPVYRWLYLTLTPKSLAYGVCFALTLALVALLSGLSYRLIERRGIAWGERLIRGSGSAA